jgi:hypothetical protein
MAGTLNGAPAHRRTDAGGAALTQLAAARRLAGLIHHD